MGNTQQPKPYATKDGQVGYISPAGQPQWPWDSFPYNPAAYGTTSDAGTSNTSPEKEVQAADLNKVLAALKRPEFGQTTLEEFDGK